jgi:hypothetical protein
MTQLFAPRSRVGRLSSLLALTSLFLLAFSGMVLAQQQNESATVSTSTVTPDRYLDLLDVVGEDLTNVALRNGRATPFQVRVSDSYIDLLHNDAPFWVQATMNNLYRVTDPEAGNLGIDVEGDRIESQHIDLGYVANSPLGARGVLADVNPRVLLESAVGSITCGEIGSALPVVGVVLDAATCLLIDAGGGTDIGELEVVTTLAEELLDDVWAAVEDLPLALDNPDSGAFTSPNCSSGLGQGDSRCLASIPTSHTVLQGTPLTVEALLAIVSGLVGDITDLVGAEDAAALVDEILAALVAAGGNTALVGDVLGDALADLDVAQQLEVIADLFAVVGVNPLDLGELLLSGQYRSLPTLKVDTGTAPEAGQYAGTLTVTLFEGSL